MSGRDDVVVGIAKEVVIRECWRVDGQSEGIVGTSIQMNTIDQEVVIGGRTEDSRMLVEWRNAILTTLQRMDSLVLDSEQEEVQDEDHSQTRNQKEDEFLQS